MTCDQYRMIRSRMPWESTRAERAAAFNHVLQCVRCEYWESNERPPMQPYTVRQKHRIDKILRADEADREAFGFFPPDLRPMRW